MENKENIVAANGAAEQPLENPVSAVPSPEFSINNLYDIIREVIGCQQISPVIQKQINEYIIRDNMTFKEIARCIVWCDEVGMKDKKDKWNPMYGIGCIRNVREATAKYFSELEKEQKQKEAEAQQAKVIAQSNIVFKVGKISKPKRSPKFYNIAEIDVGDSLEKESSTDE